MLNRATQVVAVADTDEKNRELFAGRFLARPYASFEQMLGAESLDIVGVIPRNYPEYWKARDKVDTREIGEITGINVYDPNGQGWPKSSFESFA